MPRRPAPWLPGLVARIFLVAIAYGALGWLGLLLAIPPGYASGFWPAAGLALAAVLGWGNRVWPGVFLGSFLINVWIVFDGTTFAAAWKPIILASGIGASTVLQALAGAYLVRRFIGFPTALTQDRAIGKLFVLCGPASCLVSAFIGVTCLLAAGAIRPPDYLFSWWTWWIGDTIGVLVVTPLALIWTAEPRPLWRRRRLQVAIPLLTCAALVLVVFVYASDQEEHRNERRFVLRASTISDRVAAHLATYSAALHGIESLLRSEPEIDRAAFRIFVARSLARQPAFQGLGWTPRVRDHERLEREQRARREGYPSFQIWEYSPGRKVTPAARRSEYFPAILIEPAEGNEVGIGFDVASEPTRLAALRRARDTGEIAISGRISLVSGTGGLDGVTAFMPVYDGAPRTVEERRSSLRGFCIGGFRVNDILLEALRGVDVADIDLSLVDVSGAAPVPLVSLHGGAIAAQDLLEGRLVERPMQLGGHPWALRFAPISEYAFKQRSWSVWAVLACGLLFTSLLGAFLLVLTGRSIAVAALVEERTAALRRAEERFRGLVESAPDAMVLIEDGTIALVNAQAEQLFGYSRNDLAGLEIEILVPERHRDRHRSHRTGYMQAPMVRRMGSGYELFGRRNDGSEFPIEISLSPMQSAEGLLVIATVRDITERKRLETERSQVLREKDTLLREIHHRVKNNLQVVSSLFYLQSRQTEDRRFRQLLDESRDRVQSIALVHDQLYRAADLANINFVDYLRRLTAGLKATYSGPIPRVDVAVHGGDISLDVEHAVPCGLIISELVSNAFKHAFPAGRAGKIEVYVHKEEERDVVVEVADDGIGLPETVDWRQPRSLGLQLVASLVTQLRATSELDRSQGTRFQIRFCPT